MSHPFHLAIPIGDIDIARNFYVNLLNCKEGRSTKTWIDFNFYGNQLSMHISKSILPVNCHGNVDGVSVPIPHFGIILNLEQFDLVSTNLREANIKFIIPPQVRYQDKNEEQKTMFFQDPFENSIEIKGISNIKDLY